LAAIIKDRRPCLLESPRPSLLPYYQGPADVAAFLGVPVFEGLSLRGVLLGDRKVGAVFSASEVELFTAAAEQVMRIVQSERVFQAVERSKHEHERFYRASAALNRAGGTACRRRGFHCIHGGQEQVGPAGGGRLARSGRLLRVRGA
jgi:GAF domain-containing protein